MLVGSDLDAIPEQVRPLVVSMHNEVVSLREEVSRLRRELYGTRSERHIPGVEVIEPKGSMFNEVEVEASVTRADEAADPLTPVPAKKPRVRSAEFGGRDPFRENLPRRREEFDLPAEEKVCPNDGAELEKVGERIVEKLEFKPSELVVVQYVYPVYGCPVCKGHMAQAPAVPSLLPGASCEPSLLAALIEQKYVWGTPLYRLEQQLEQAGAKVARAKIARWIIAAADALGDVAYEIKARILSLPAIHADETNVQVLKNSGKPPTSDNYMWTLCTPLGEVPAVWFQYAPSRDKAAAARLLESFTGLLHIDGFEGYTETVSRNGIARVGCWAHARRYFDTAKKDGAASGKSLAGEFLDDIQKLFLLEREWETLMPEERLTQRQVSSKPIVDRIRERLDKERHAVPLKSKLGGALTYLANQWTLSWSSYWRRTPRSRTIAWRTSFAPSPWAGRTGSSPTPPRGPRPARSFTRSQ